METGECCGVLEGHTFRVWALAVCGSRLASGSDDYSIKVWTMGPGASWPCERTLVGHSDAVYALETWQNKVISGSRDDSVQVWDMETGVHEATLADHTGPVCRLLVDRDRLFTASHDGTIREWAVGTWAALRTVEAYGQDAGQAPWCLAVSGSMLICGTCLKYDDDDAQQYEVQVWDLGTLELKHTLQQPAGARVWCLAAVGGEVWGGVGDQVVVWGRE